MTCFNQWNVSENDVIWEETLKASAQFTMLPFPASAIKEAQRWNLSQLASLIEGNTAQNTAGQLVIDEEH